MANKKKEVIEAEIEVKDSSTVVEEKKVVKTQKAFFFPRVIAYIIDIIIVSLLSSLVMMILPQSDNYNKYLKEYEQIQTDLLDEKITADEYIQRSIEVVHDLDYSNVISMIVEVVILILYFVVFQCYNRGQTFGKKIMHIKVVSNNEDKLTFNNFIYRSVIIHSLLANVLIIGMVLFVDKTVYYYSSFALQGIQMLLIIISIFMVMYKKDGRGIQDLVGNTKVVMCNEE